LKLRKDLYICINSWILNFNCLDLLWWLYFHKHDHIFKNILYTELLLSLSTCTSELLARTFYSKDSKEVCQHCMMANTFTISRVKLYRSWCRKITISEIFTGVLCTVGGTLVIMYVTLWSKMDNLDNTGPPFIKVSLYSTAFVRCLTLYYCSCYYM
jgi:hypothetical protein